MTRDPIKRFGPFVVLAAIVVAAVIAIPALGGNDPAQQPLVHVSGGGSSAGFQDTVAKALPSVVQIQSSLGLGSGIVLDRKGDVVTNAHVVAGARRFQVTAPDGSKHAATLRGTFPEGDLAVIQVAGAKLTPATFADSSKVQVGEIALAIGNPLGLRSSVTQGIVSSTSRTVSEGNGVALPSVIQTSAPINPGNSGGALVDETGAVIGIPTLAALDPEMNGAPAPGIGFAISSNTVKSIAGQLSKTGRVQDSARAWLGVELRSLTQGGVVVARLTSGGPAARAGLRVGDVVTTVAGKQVQTVDDIAVALAQERPGSRVAIEVREAAGARTVHVTLGQIPPAK